MEQPSKKRVYDAPKLVRYGDLAEVTRNLPSGGKNDNAHTSNKT
jgi:hypothetical protein